MANPLPPQPVLLEFLRIMAPATEDEWETLIPVVRGSVLMQRWYGDLARPAADIDLECFDRGRTGEAASEFEEMLADQEEEERAELTERYGSWGEYESLVDYGKAMGRYSAQSTGPGWRDRGPSPVEFTRTEDNDVPEGTASLWTYGTPGARYFTNYIWHQNGGATGQIQIDFAESGHYKLDDIDTANVTFQAPGGSFEMLSYTPEMLLAAKLSWVLRSLKVDGDSVTWSGEPKDIFDAHLLLTHPVGEDQKIKQDMFEGVNSGGLNAARFQKSLVAVGQEHGLDWAQLDAL